jgi:hypothetical protein
VRGSSAGLITALLTVVVLFTLAGYQVTTVTAGVRLEGRLGAALIELDRWLPAHREDLNLLSRDRPTAPLVLPDVPIEVSIPADQIANASDAALEAEIRRAMGEVLYQQGSGAVHDEQGKTHLSVTDPVRWAINLTGEGAHSFWRTVLLITTVLLLAVCAGQLYGRHSPLPGLAVGGGVAAGGALIVWLAAHALNSALDSAVDKEIALVLRDGAWLGLRNGLAVVAIALSALYLLGVVARRDGHEGWQDDERSYDAYDSFDSLEPPPDAPTY